jgi:hypothetical protein
MIPLIAPFFCFCTGQLAIRVRNAQPHKPTRAEKDKNAACLQRAK